MIKSDLTPMSVKNFWAKVERIPFHDCWEWVAACNEKGYGVFGQGKCTDKAHRIAYRLIVGEIPKGAFLLHSCDNPSCVNPRHLRPGTNRENVHDMHTRNRASPPPPMGGHNRKIVPENLLTLLGIIPDTEIAAQANCTKKVIQRLRKERGIKPCENTTRFKKGAPHPRWPKKGGK